MKHLTWWLQGQMLPPEKDQPECFSPDEPSPGRFLPPFDFQLQVVWTLFLSVFECLLTGHAPPISILSLPLLSPPHQFTILVLHLLVNKYQNIFWISPQSKTTILIAQLCFDLIASWQYRCFLNLLVSTKIFLGPLPHQKPLFFAHLCFDVFSSWQDWWVGWVDVVGYHWTLIQELNKTVDWILVHINISCHQHIFKNHDKPL